MKSLLLYFCTRCGGAFAHPAQCGAQPAGEAGLKSHSEIRIQKIWKECQQFNVCKETDVIQHPVYHARKNREETVVDKKIDQQKVQCDDVMIS